MAWVNVVPKLQLVLPNYLLTRTRFSKLADLSLDKHRVHPPQCGKRVEKAEKRVEKAEKRVEKADKRVEWKDEMKSCPESNKFILGLLFWLDNVHTLANSVVLPVARALRKIK